MSSKAHRLQPREWNGEFGACSLMTNYTQRAERIEVEGLQRPALNGGPYVSCQGSPFAQRELRRGWTGIAGLSILERCAIAHRPHAGMSRDSHGALDDYRAPPVRLDR